jgi:hypothetical protein
VNNKKGTLKFTEGDIVEMEFDAAAMALRLCCNGQHSSFAVSPPQKDCYRFIVYLGNNSDKFELLSD